MKRPSSYRLNEEDSPWEKRGAEMSRERGISRLDRRELIKEETPNLIEEDSSPKIPNKLAGKVEGEGALKCLEGGALSVGSSFMSQEAEDIGRGVSRANLLDLE